MTPMRWVEGSVVDKNDIRSAPVELWILLEPELHAFIIPVQDGREVATKGRHSFLNKICEARMISFNKQDDWKC